ncbi:Uncharacterized protein involved in exopolysaccharide biosynthesis [Arboricoccus pini]|uniref:Uncharacterized protein involved in exopolysaccharide biosynthesis n=1 Tax=Arboricoccus pini TaxID=1963835 RepID=A0A212RSF8_9PROT|nr:exopolysaccharide transport family protein [Arboricoccus pini]SNB75467.1 Uncharacterized protein involved in exopolysaccharide biosynthesis [Arboricoccus pini]
MNEAMTRTGGLPLEISWADVLRVWRRWIVVIGLIALGGGAAAVYLASRIEPTYDTQSVILFDRPDAGKIKGAAETAPIDASTRAWLVRSQVEILRSSNLVREVVDELHLTDEPMFQPKGPGLVGTGVAYAKTFLSQWLPSLKPQPVENLADADSVTREYLNRLTVQQDPDTYILRVGFRAPDAALAAKIANAHTQAYFAWLQQQGAGAIGGTSDWLKQAVDSAHDRLITAENNVEAYRSKNALVDVGGRTALEQQLAQMSADLAAAQAAMVSKQARANEILRLQQAGQVEGIVSMSGSRTLEELESQLGQVSANVASLESVRGSAYPDVRTARASRDKLQSAVRSEIGKIIEGETSEAKIAAANVQQLTVALNELKSKTLGAENQRAELSRLEGEAETERSVYLSLLQQMRGYDRAGELIKADATLLSPALIPDMPSSPRTGLFGIFGFCISGGLSALALVWRENRREVVRHTGDMTTYSGVRCIGIMPKFSRRRQGSWDRSHAKYLFFREELRSICAHLLRSPSRGLRKNMTVLVTSALPGEGKSTFSYELGRFAAENGVRVLLVSTDLKSKNALMGTFPASLEPSLSFDGVVWPAPATTWETDRRQLLASWQQEYGLIVIDTPPLSAMAASAILAPMADDTLVLGRVDQTPRLLLNSVVRQIEASGGRVAGTVLTFAQLDQKKGLLPSDFGYYFQRNREYLQVSKVPQIRDDSRSSNG